jgi:DNA repair exonuclease SbcCD ATPase subunit
LNFEQIELHNYGSHQETVHQIRPGKFLIVGQNGDGKSTLFEGLVGCLYKLTRSRDPSFKHQGNCEVRTKLTLDEKQVEIRRYWGMKDKVKSPQIYVNEEELGFRRSTESEKELQNLLSISSDLFVSTVVVMQGLPMNFCNMSATIRKTIIEDLFGFNVWDAIRKQFSKTIKEDLGKSNELGATFEKDREKMISLSTRINTLKEVGNESEEQFEKEVLQIKDKLRETVESIEAYKDQNNWNEDEESKLQNQVEVLNNSLQMMVKRHNELRSVIDTGKCYTCHRDFPHSLIQASTEEADMLHGKIGKTTEVAKDVREQLTLASGIESNIKSYENHVRDLTNQLSAKRSAKPTLNQNVDFTQMETELADIQATVNSLNTELESMKDGVEKLRYIDGTLKPSSDFRTQVLKDRIGSVNRLIGRICPLLFDNVQCQLLLTMSGIELDIVRDNQNIEYKELSGGERRRIDIAMIFSFQKYIQEASGVSSNLLVFDEIFENLDAVGVEAVLNCVETLFPDASSIYVITHRENIKSQFNSLIRVTKTNGVSKLEEK